MPDDQQCPQTEWLADLKNLISSAEDKERGGQGKKGEKKKKVCVQKMHKSMPLYIQFI